MPDADAPDWLRLASGERPVWTGRPSLVRVADWLAVAVVLVLLGLLGPVFLPAGLWWLSPAAVLGGLLAGSVASVRYRSVQYVVTTQAVYRRLGLLSRSVTTIPLDRIQNTAYTQSPGQRLLSYGDVRLNTAGSGGTELILEAVPNPDRVAGIVADQIHRDGTIAT